MTPPETENIPYHRPPVFPPLFILGPTGCGKSAVAVALARKLGHAEIVSADAYQVYRGMGILTAAPSAEELGAVPHHLIGFLSPAENNDAATHARRAQARLADIAARGKRAIVTGGSGLYVKFISHGISPAPPGDPALRAELNALPPEELVRRLQAADPEGAAATDLANPRYVARNLEIVLCGGKPLAYWRNNWTHQAPAGPMFCLVRETAELDARIARRARAMLAEGVVEEVRTLLQSGPPLSATAGKTLGLSAIRSHLAGELPLPELAPAIALATRQYAKRQRTWLRREQDLIPLAVAANARPEALTDEILLQLQQRGSREQ